MSIDLTALTPRAWDIWLEAYEAGAVAGWADGYRTAEDDMAALWRRAHAVVQHIARQPPYAELADRRGEHDRAEAQRRTLAERGIT